MWETIQKMPVWGVIGAILSAITVVLGFLNIGFGKKEVVKNLFNWIVDQFRFHYRLRKSIELLQMQVKEIHHQTHNNGGSSMKDQMDRLAAMMLEMQIRQRQQTKLEPKYMSFDMMPDGRVADISETFLLVFGYAESEIEGFGWENAVHPDDVQKARDGWARAAKYCERFSMVQRIRHSNGTYYDCKVEGDPIPGAKQCVIKFVGTIQLIPKNN